MSDTIIKVENISKRYRIGLKEEKAKTFAEQLIRTLKYPLKNFQNIRNLGKFGKDEEGVHWALKDVNFEVKQGEVLGIIGKNGAGKSTLLKILSRITEPTSGRITVYGRIAALLEVGTGFHPELTGRENIYMNGTILGMTKKEIDRKLDEIIDFSGVEKYMDTPVKFYSSGMRVRLGFSVAAHLDPEILVVDEVLSVGDYEFQQKCLGKMEDVSQREGRTVLFVSHNMGAVQSLCSKVLILDKGRASKKSDTNDGIKSYIDLGFIKNKNFESLFVERILLLDQNKRESNVLKGSEYIYVKIDYKNGFNLEDYDIGFFVKDKYGDKITSVSTSFKKPTPEDNKELNSIIFSLKDLKLVDDIYSIDISIVRKGGKRVEFIEDVIKFQIISNDFYNSGTTLNSYFGKYYLDFDYNA